MTGAVRTLMAAIALACMPAALAVDIDPAVTKRFDGRALAPAEGVWLWSSGALVAVESDISGNLVMTMVDSPDPLETVPRVIGHATFTGAESTYDIELATAGDLNTDNAAQRTARFTGRFSRDGHLSLTPYSTGLRINVRRLVPYLFRVSVSRPEQPKNLEGAVRVWPDRGTPDNPIVL